MTEPASTVTLLAWMGTPAPAQLLATCALVFVPRQISVEVVVSHRSPQAFKLTPPASLVLWPRQISVEVVVSHRSPDTFKLTPPARLSVAVLVNNTLLNV